MKKLFIIFLLFSFQAESQPPMFKLLVKRQTPSFILDSLSSASTQSAYSLRKIKSSYSGSCIRVRRSSDNTESDIGFVNNILDTTSLKDFVTSNSGYVVTWYDQSGNGRNVTQASSGSQPRIIDAGTVERDGGNLTMRFLGSGYVLATSSYQAYPDSIITNYVMRVHTNSTYNASVTKNTGAEPNPIDYYTTTLYIGDGAGNLVSATSSTSFNASTALKTWTNIGAYRSGTTYAFIYVNGTSTGSNSAAGDRYSDVNNALRIGSRGDAVTAFNGYAMEVVTFSAISDSDRSLLDNNQILFYGL